MTSASSTKLVQSVARKPPAAGKGRKRGSRNKIPRLLKEAITEAAEVVGSDGSGRDGLVGYFKGLAIKEPKAFAGLLGRIIPLQVSGAGDENDQPAAIEFRIVDPVNSSRHGY